MRLLGDIRAGKTREGRERLYQMGMDKWGPIQGRSGMAQINQTLIGKKNRRLENEYHENRYGGDN